MKGEQKAARQANVTPQGRLSGLNGFERAVARRRERDAVRQKWRAHKRRVRARPCGHPRKNWPPPIEGTVVTS